MSDLSAPARPDDGRGPDLSRFLPQRSFGLKLILVCGLALLMSIPASFVWLLIEGRSRDAAGAAAQVAQDWGGGAQTFMGPVILVPYERDVMVDNKLQTVSGQLVLYPETGDITAKLDAETRTKGLQRVPVYRADAAFTAVFEPGRLAQAAPTGARVLWKDARMVLSATDLRGADAATLLVDGAPLELAPADGGQVSYQPLLGAPLPNLETRQTGQMQVAATLRFKGSERLGFAPFAKTTAIRLTGDWPAPKFDGGRLPETRSIGAQGFDAQWNVPFLARGAAGAGADLNFSAIYTSTPGVSLIDEANPYQKVIRALKYAPMFLGLVFLTYFLFETTSGRRAHPAQYVLVGLAQTVFYMLLLSVSEMVGFAGGFVIAAVATVLAISLYAGSVFGAASSAIKAGVVFSGLYALIYVLLSMEDYALLVGSIASFIAIAGTMWMTRRLDWYGAARNQRTDQSIA
jgi:inner membrane protein